MEIGSYTHQNHCILDGAGIFPCSSVDIQVATLRFVATKIVGCLGASQPLQVRNTQACPCQTLVTYQTLDQQQAPVEQICNKQNMLHLSGELAYVCVFECARKAFAHGRTGCSDGWVFPNLYGKK